MTLNELKNNFELKSGDGITIEEYSIISLTYPSYRVAVADDNFDEDEQNLMKSILGNFINEVYKDLSANQKDELSIGLLNSLIWVESNFHNELVQSLKILCEKHSDLPNVVNDLINEMAEASGGVSNEEKSVIKEIKSEMK